MSDNGTDPIQISFLASDKDAIAAIDRMVAQLESLKPASKGAADALDGLTASTEKASDGAETLTESTQTATDSIVKLSDAERRAEEAGRKFDAMARTIKVSGVFDGVAESAVGAEKEIKKTGETLRQSFSRTGGLATDPAKFFEEAAFSAKKVTQETSKIAVAAKAAADPIKSCISEPIKSIGITMQGLRTIENALGLHRLPMLNADLRVMQSLIEGMGGGIGGGGIGGISSVGAAAVSGSGLIAAVGAATAVAGLVGAEMLTINRILKTETETLENGAANSRKILQSINDRVNKGLVEGTLDDSGGFATQAKKQAGQLQSAQNRLDSYGKDIPPDMFGELARAMPSVFKEVADHLDGTTEDRQRMQDQILSQERILLKNIEELRVVSSETIRKMNLDDQKQLEQVNDIGAAHRKQTEQNTLQAILSDRTKNDEEKIAAMERFAAKEIEINNSVLKAKKETLKVELDNLLEYQKTVSEDVELNAKAELDITSVKRQMLNADLSSTYANSQVLSQTKLSTNAIKQNDPGFIKQITGNVNQLKAAWKGVGTQAADALTGVTSRSIGTLSTGLTKVVMGAESLGAAMRDIGTTILTDIIEAIIEMGVKWVVTHVLMEGVLATWQGILSAFRAKDVVEANATETAKTPALAANATLASIESWGIAVAIGLAAIAGILAATGAFAEGGYTGDGSKWQVAGVVHRGEYVLTKEQVSRIGLANVAAFAKGMHPGAPVPIPVAQSSGTYAGGGLVGSMPSLQSGPVNIGIVGTRQQYRDFMRQEGAQIVNADNRKRGNRMQA